MILSSSTVEQAIDGDHRATLVKQIVLARRNGTAPALLADDVPAGEGAVPLAMVRKRSALQPPSADRAALLLIHGYGQNRYVWHLPARSFANYLATAGFDVFSLDLRGHGRSRHLGAHPPKRITELVREDLPTALAEVQRLTGPRPIFLVGHSLGGLVSYAAAPAHAGVVKGIVTLGSPYHFTRGSRFLPLVGDAVLALDRRLHLGHGALPLRYVGEAMRLARVLIESPFVPLPIRSHAPGSMEPRVLGQHMSLAMDRGSIAVVRSMFFRAAEARASGHRLGVLYGYAAAFEALDIPLLIIAGSEDSLAPPEAVRPAYERSRSTDKTYRVFPRGHIDLIVGRDAPYTIWPLVLTWLGTRLRRIEPRRPAHSGAPPVAG
ncbi:MAG: alpha/beta fold hydrolase [Deltaproteobacteria bacterium]|nr:alpha/beta fold hydrolase [Deltaproteobacteria bacterium]